MDDEIEYKSPQILEGECTKQNVQDNVIINYSLEELMNYFNSVGKRRKESPISLSFPTFPSFSF